MAISTELAPPAERAQLPFAFARRHGVLVHELREDGAQIWHRPGIGLEALTALQALLLCPLRLQEVPAAEFDQALERRYAGDGGEAAAAAHTLDAQPLEDLSQALGEPQDLLESADDAPVIRFINAVLGEAVREGASDIHIEPAERDVRVRFRIDGVLRDILRPRGGLAPVIISRIKVMARLDIAEKRLPQDGRISLRIGGRPVDVRVSTLPSAHGERVVLRLLDKQAGRLDLAQIGMIERDAQRLAQIIQRPHGIVLVTGPTGSGKTTTLYAALTRLNESSRNIMTVEDPIEYFLDGISQTAVNPRVDMSFARGLRAILRQDPDVVMVGEIRDLETARIAVQASLTGHLVLSTLHTNTAVGAVTRLIDMGIEPFLLSSSLLATLAQRLVRRLCLECREAYTPDAAERALVGLPADLAATFYRPVGCSACQQTGYRGRIGIYELVEIDERLRSLIHDRAAEATLEAQARSQAPSIREEAVGKLCAGITSLEEVLRVTREG